jgi:hypothetical protein
MVFHKAAHEPAGKTKKLSQDIWFLTNNIQANRVAIVSSIITKIFNLASIGRSRFNLSFNIQWFSVCFVRYQLLFDCCLSCFILFDFIVQLFMFDNSVYFSVLILELYSRYFDPLNNNHLAVNKHHTADSTILFCFFSLLIILNSHPKFSYLLRCKCVSKSNPSIY